MIKVELSLAALLLVLCLLTAQLRIVDIQTVAGWVVTIMGWALGVLTQTPGSGGPEAKP